MTILSTTLRVQEQGNGSKVAFDFTFPVQNSTHLKVYKINRTTEVETLQTLGVDYTVALSTTTDGGTVTYTTAPTASQDSLIYREVPLTQTSDVPSNNIFREEQIETALDKLMMAIQQLDERIDRSITLPIGSSLTNLELPSPEAGKAIVGNATEDGFENSSVDLTSLEADVAAVDAAVTAAQLAETNAEAAETAAEAAQAAAELAASQFTLASQAEAEAGSNNVKYMSALRTAQAIAALVASGVASDGTVGLQNLLTNSGFEQWTLGTNVAPDGWTLSGTGAAVARSTSKYAGAYSARLTNQVSQVLGLGFMTVADTKGVDYFKGKTITFSCRINCAYANRVTLSIGDGIGATYSSSHAGTGWQLLTVTHTVSNSATSVAAYINISSGASISIYADEAMLVEGSSAFASSPKPAEEQGWVDYSSLSTVTGWSSFTAKRIEIKRIGTIRFVRFLIDGTSNSTSASFTLPEANGNPGAYVGGSLTVNINNGSYPADNMGRMVMSPGGATVSITVTNQGMWVSSGQKYVSGNFFYDTQSMA